MLEVHQFHFEAQILAEFHSLPASLEIHVCVVHNHILVFELGSADGQFTLGSDVFLHLRSPLGDLGTIHVLSTDGVVVHDHSVGILSCMFSSPGTLARSRKPYGNVRCQLHILYISTCFNHGRLHLKIKSVAKDSL